MSWLLVAFIPGLLMLATFGLDRLEAGLTDDTVSPRDVAAVLERAKADCAKPAARRASTRADGPFDAEYAGYAGYSGRYSEPLLAEPAEHLPTRICVRHAANTEFQPTRQPYRV